MKTQFYFYYHLGFENPYLPTDVGLHGICETVGVRSKQSGGDRAGQEVERPLRVPDGVDHHRVRHRARVRHDSNRRTVGLERIRNCSAAR
jgi:hypothetical protein